VSPYPFTRNDRPTLGVELELQLVDAQTLALRNAVGAILADLPEELEGSVKPELMQSYIEINTAVCDDVAAVGRDLETKVRQVEEIAARHNLRLYWAATHPFSPWWEQEVTPNERYYGLVDLLQESARRLVTFGLHVHVGVDSGDKAVMVCDRIMRHLPTLLALSANSPFWNGRVTGLRSHRVKVMEGLPTAGLPPQMRNWSEYVWLLNHLTETGFIRTIRELWWDVRPHHNFGTVEVRICDLPPDLHAVLALTALVQCLVHRISEEVDRGIFRFDTHPMLVQQNKWRACRFGLDASLVDLDTRTPRPARQVARDLVARLRDDAKALGCEPHLDALLALADGPTGADRQLAIFERTGDLTEVVRQGLGMAAGPA
jgi:glutamate---cysteine ligase / carboxylate-amine ligase